MFGTLPNPPKLAYDPAAAKKLLAEAGYANGFQLTLSTTNDRYINDSQITQAVAQYLTQVGIRTEVDAMTRAIYFPRRAKKEFSVAIGGWGSTSGEASSFLRQWPADAGRGEDASAARTTAATRSGVRQADPHGDRHARRRQARGAAPAGRQRWSSKAAPSSRCISRARIWAYKSDLDLYRPRGPVHDGDVGEAREVSQSTNEAASRSERPRP